MYLIPSTFVLVASIYRNPDLAGFLFISVAGALMGILLFISRYRWMQRFASMDQTTLPKGTMSDHKLMLILYGTLTPLWIVLVMSKLIPEGLVPELAIKLLALMTFLLISFATWTEYGYIQLRERFKPDW